MSKKRYAAAIAASTAIGGLGIAGTANAEFDECDIDSEVPCDDSGDVRVLRLPNNVQLTIPFPFIPPAMPDIPNGPDESPFAPGVPFQQVPGFPGAFLPPAGVFLFIPPPMP